MTLDLVNHPAHYTSSDARCSRCGETIECIQVTEHMPFCLGNTIKYCWRVDMKGDPIENLEKAAWYLAREIKRRRSLHADTVVAAVTDAMRVRAGG